MIIYIHGFGGSGQGNKAQQFREYFCSQDKGFIAPSLSYVPELAMKTLEELIESYNEDVYLIGSSLGGFYATYLSQLQAVKRVVLINPAINADVTLQKSVGRSKNFYDLSTFEWNTRHIQMLEHFKSKFASIVHTNQEKYLLLVQKGDELLDYEEAVTFYTDAKQIVEEGGSHSFDGIERYFQQIETFFSR